MTRERDESTRSSVQHIVYSLEKENKAPYSLEKETRRLRIVVTATSRATKGLLLDSSVVIRPYS
jgi:hypothetical protein